MRLKILGAFLPLLSSCHGYLLEPSPAPLPMVYVPTKGGEYLAAHEGLLFLSAGRSDIGAVLGAALEEDAQGVLVTNRLRADTTLEPGDRIVYVAAAIPPISPPVMQLPREKSKPRAEERPEPPAPANLAELRALPQAHEVRSLDDLRGYRCCNRLLSIDLGVVRGDAEIVVRQKVETVRTPVPVARHDPDLVFRKNGIEICKLDSWPEERRPVGAEATDTLITYIERDSAAGRAGLRPLDLVTNGNDFARTGLARVRGRDGSLKDIQVKSPETTLDFWIPFVVSLETDGTREHAGFGPFDLIHHYSEKIVYNASTDSYDRIERWSCFSLFQGRSREGQASKDEWTSLNPFLDLARLDYLLDRYPSRSHGPPSNPQWGAAPGGPADSSK